MEKTSMENTEKSFVETPKWLNILENRLNKPFKLAHELGAGSPCLVCKDKCSGLNLHYWRKICIQCKCKKDDHDLIDKQECDQFEILFGTKRVKKITLKCNSLLKTFDWVPQDVSQELVLDYLNAIPQSKLPITNTEGAIYRKQQLEKQLPLHDVNPSACHNLTDKEVDEFTKYLDNLRNNVIGQGKIMKFPFKKLHKGDFYQSDSNTSKCLWNENTVLACYGTLVTENQPEMNVISSQNIDFDSHCAKAIFEIDKINQNQSYSEPLSNVAFMSEPLKIKPINNVKVSCEKTLENANCSEISEKIEDLIVSNTKSYSVKKYSEEKVSNNFNKMKDLLPGKDFKMADSFLQKIMPSSDQENNNNSNIYIIDSNCNDEMTQNNDNNTIQHDQSSDSEIHLKSLHKDLRIKSPSYGFHSSNIEKMSQNISKSHSEQIAFTPVMESHNISQKKVPCGNKYVKDQNQAVANELAQRCRQCEEIFVANDIVVTTEHAGNTALWHAKCFICDICKELLVDLMYFFCNGKIYCGRDYARIVNIPRCFACDELIFVKEFTYAEGEYYHFKHFCCFHCDEPLGGKQYIPKNSQPVCLECCQRVYGKTCCTCLQPIAVAEQRVSLAERHYHVNPECFRCRNCLKSLLGQKFVIKIENTFCNKECVQIFQKQYS